MARKDKEVLETEVVETTEAETAETEVSEEQAAIQAAFDESEGQAEDEVKMAMIAAGATFKNVTRLYNQFMIDSGKAISKVDRDVIVADALEGKDLASEEVFDACVDALVKAIKGATERSVAALIRAYGKKNEVEVYAKPKGTGAGRTSFASTFYAFLEGKPSMTEAEATAFINGEGDHADTTDNVKKHKSHYLGIWKLVNGIATAA